MEFRVASTDACVISNFVSTDVRLLASLFSIEERPILRSDESVSINFWSPSMSLSKLSILSDVAHRV